MPLYEVLHICPLTPGQLDEIAAAITKIHSDTFTTPKLFVNVKFTDVSQQALYVAGKRRSSNSVIANVRHGPMRTQALYKSLCNEVHAAWNSIVPLPQVKRSVPAPDTELRAILIQGSIVAAWEVGFMVPQAGGDKEWLAENLEAFQAKADAGDEDFKDMVADVKQRGLTANGDGRTATQKLEEALGWGESA